MEEQAEKRFSTRKRCRWILRNYSTLQHEFYNSSPFVLGGKNWHILAYLKYKEHLSVYIGLIYPELLPSEWRANVRFRLTLVNKLKKNDTRVLDGQTWFDAKKHTWGFEEVMPISKLDSKDDGFVVDDCLTILAELQVFPLVPEPKEILSFVEALSNKIQNQAADASLNRSQGDSSCQVKQNTENDASPENVDYDVSEKKNPCVVNTSEESSKGSDDGSEEDSDDGDGSDEESSDDDEDASEESSEDDASEESSEDDASDESSDDEYDTSEESSEDDASDESSDDDASGASEKCSEDDEASSSVSDAGGTDKIPSLIAGTGETRCTDLVKYVDKVNLFNKEIQPVKDTMYVNGFQVLSSQVESVRHIFKRHPDIALHFRPKNQKIRRAYLNELLSLIEMLCKSPEKLSKNDLRNADETLGDLIAVGFKLGWLRKKLNEVIEKKKIEEGSEYRLLRMQAELTRHINMVTILDSQIQKEMADVSAAKTPLSFNDVVS